MKKIGVLGGGQLGMMLQQEHDGSSSELHFLDPNPNCSVSSLTENLQIGDFNVREDVLRFGADMDILTVEIEHVHTGALRELESQGKKVYPQPDVLELIQDKGRQKEFYTEHGFPSAPFELIDSGAEAATLSKFFPYVLKSCTGGYDGKGVQIVREENDLKDTFPGPCVVEDLADLKNELSVIVARNACGEISSYPVVEMEFDPESNLVMALISPAQVSREISDEAKQIAESLIKTMDMVGLLAVEFFLLKDDTLWVNEVAPRPHNSGHHSIEGNKTSQYQQHIRAISDLPLGNTEVSGHAVMVNLIGEKGHLGPKHIEGVEQIDADEDAYLHDYLKQETRPGRKMGHITVVKDNRKEAHDLAMTLLAEVKVLTKG